MSRGFCDLQLNTSCSKEEKANVHKIGPRPQFAALSEPGDLISLCWDTLPPSLIHYPAKLGYDFLWKLNFKFLGWLTCPSSKPLRQCTFTFVHMSPDLMITPSHKMGVLWRQIERGKEGNPLMPHLPRPTTWLANPSCKGVLQSNNVILLVSTVEGRQRRRGLGMEVLG